MTNPQFEAIFPLTGNQKTFLMHNLQKKKGADIGEMQAYINLEGNLDLDLFKRAWQKTQQRHSALRTSIHWENIETPLQVIHPNANIPITFFDWSHLSQQSFESKLEDLRNDTQYIPKLSKPPITNVILIKKSKTEFTFLWNCHHILFDGWSTSIVLQDLFNYYSGLVKSEDIYLREVPRYKSYIHDLKNQNTKEAKLFWKNYLPQDITPSIIQDGETLVDKGSSINNYPIILDEELNKLSHTFCRKSLITHNTLIRGVWAILLHRFFDSEKIVFGTTVSGRTMDIPNVDLMVGLFTNVIPLLSILEPDVSITKWLGRLQKKHSSAFKYGNVSFSQILSWLNTKHSLLFNSILIYENIPWKDFEKGGIKVKANLEMQKSNFPLTIGINPEKGIINLRYNEEFLSKKIIIWFAKQFRFCLERILYSDDHNLKDLLNQLAPTPYDNDNTSNPLISNTRVDYKYHPPQNQIELKLVQIWENILDHKPIGISDNFFEIGGTSIHAVRLLGQIKNQLNFDLPPVALIQNPTIRQLTTLITGEQSIPDWSYLTPLKATGNKPPLYCLHAGGGHTFFYNAIIKYLEEDQPVYSVQPFLSNVENRLHESIEEMASDYIKDIKAIQPEGSYILLSYCFSIALGIEMIRQLEKDGVTNASLIIIDTSLPYSLFTGGLDQISRLQYYWKTEGAKKIQSLVKNKIYSILRVGRFSNKNSRVEKDKTLHDEKALQAMINNLVNIHIAYNWKKQWVSPKSKITFIRSSESIENNGLRAVERYNEFFQNDVEVVTVKGKHLTLFEEPEVQNLAKVIQKALDNFALSPNINLDK